MTATAPRFSLRTLVLGFIALNIVLSACTIFFYALVIGNSRFRTEWDHGVKLPPSARNFQCRGDAWRCFLDRDAVAVFEVESNEAKSFLATLNIESEFPLPNVPGNQPLDGISLSYSIPIAGTTQQWTNYPRPTGGNPNALHRTWTGTPQPIRALHCKSPVGDWLQIIEWEVDGHTLLQLSTNWN